MVNAVEAENSSDVIMGNLSVNGIPAKVLFDSGASHSFMSYLFAFGNNSATEFLPKSLQVVSPGMRMSS